MVCAAGSTYTYDGDGGVVEKTGGNGVTSLYWGVLAESGTNGTITSEYIFSQGKRIARRDVTTGSVYYYFEDMLGSSSVLSTSTGAVENESDYYPFGGESVITQNLTNQKFKFTGKERDTESGNDYFGARYFGSSMGRFMSPDDGSGLLNSPSDPQSWNLYSYVGNNPLSRVDDDGHDYYLVGGSECGQNGVSCDKDGYVTGSDGNRQVVTDAQTQNGGAILTQGANGGVNVTTGQGTFAGQFFDASPGAVSATVSADPPISGFSQSFIAQTNAYNQGAKPLLAVMAGNALAGVSIPLLPMAGGSELISLGAGDELGITSNAAANEMIGATQRDLLKQFFKTGKLPEGLTQGTLRIYRAVAERAIQRYEAGTVSER